MEPVEISSTEKDMLIGLSETLQLSVLEYDQLYYAYRYVKAQGIAAETDIKEIIGLGIPLHQALADVKMVSVEDIRSKLVSGSITSEDVENAFVQMTTASGLYFK